MALTYWLGGALDALVLWLLDAWPKARSGWRLSSRDFILRMLFGDGTPYADAQPCTGRESMTEAWFGAAVDARITILGPHPNASGWVVDDTQHTWVQGKKFFTKESGGVALLAFFDAFLAGDPPRVSP